MAIKIYSSHFNAINGLEESIGARLFQRTTRRIALTTEGEQFYERALKTLAEVAETQNLFGGNTQIPRGRLRIDIPVALAKPLVIPRLAEFKALFPEIDIILGVSDQPVYLIAEGVDCVLRIGNLPVSSMVGRVIAQMRMILCASPADLDAHGEPKDVADLPGHEG